MKLRSLTVDQFKRFTLPTRLSGLNDGLNLVVGPNEFGKSTMVDALRAVLFERHSSRAQPIRSLQNDRSTAAPVVELVFEVGGNEYTLTKRFVNSPFARLQCPGGILLEADAAENELRNLLGFTAAGNRGANLESLGMWGVLWVQQGQSFGRPSVSDSALASLSSGLDSEVGTVLGGRRGRQLPQIIEQLRDELVTPSRRQPRGEYKVACDSVDELKQRLIEQQQQQQEMSEKLEQLSATEARLHRLEKASLNQIDQAELTEAKEQHDEIMRLDLQLKAARSELQNRESRLEQCERAQSDRAARRQELKTDRELLVQEQGRLEELQQKEREAITALNKLRKNLSDTEGNVEAAIQSETHWRRTLDRINHSVELKNLTRQMKDVEVAETKLADAKRQAEAMRISDESLQRIREIAEVVNRADAQLRVAATRIRFEIPNDHLNGIEIDGTQLRDSSTTIEAIESVAITIPERGTIFIEPAVVNHDRIIREAREAKVNLDEALSDVGAQSLAEAQVLRDQRRDFEVTAREARQELQRILQSDDASTLGARIDVLRQELENLSREDDLKTLPQRAEAEFALAAAHTNLQQAREDARIERANVDVRVPAVSELSVDVRTLDNFVDSQAELVDRRDRRLRSDSLAVPDQQLAGATEEAVQDVEAQQEVVASLEEQWTPSARAQLEARISRLENTIAQRDKARVDARIEIVQLREHIDVHDSAGIDEAIEHTQHELEQATRRRKRFERELEVLVLLADTLRAAEGEARERYLAPVVKRVHPYLQMLFPNAQIGIDENLHITGMFRNPGYEENFDHLSMGTQEQIAVLVRLAFAEMLTDHEAPAAVVLDDALVFADDHRMQLMFDILSHAANRVQVLMFTCREQLFEGLGAHQLQLTTLEPDVL